jgi:hypothetical protein
MSGAPKTSNTPVTMDARKFVRQINSGAAAKLKTLEEAVERLGKNAGRTLRLTSVDTNTLFYEDVEANKFYIADIRKGNRGRIHIDNIRPVQIVEENKASQFSKNVRDLVENICSGDLTNADKLFSKIEGQRFRSKVIPESGWITLRDGVARHIPVSTRIVKEERAANIVRVFSESVKDSVDVDNGRIVRGTLNDGEQKFVIPINEYTRRRLVAHKMRSVASGAYKSAAFSEMVVQTASLVCEGKVAKACKLAAKFLKEEQEFCLLDSKGMLQLVENALATKAHFNSMLGSDVAMLMHKTNLKVNKQAILEAWTKMAQKSEHAGLLNNVNYLAESTNFSGDYDRFLDIVFNEELNIQQARAAAYRKTLRMIAAALPELEDDPDEEISSSLDELNELIERLSGPEPDTDAILQAEELLAGISDSLVDSVQDLAGFDQTEGGEEEPEDEGSDLVPMPEAGEGELEDEEEDEEEGPPAEGGPPLPPAAEGPPMGLPESKIIPVEKMGVSALLEELEAWRVHGETYLAEDGYDSCYGDMQRYVKRCIEIGPKANVIRENFEGMRDLMVRTGDQVLEDLSDDPYTESVMAALNGSDKLLESNNSNDPERDPNFWDQKLPTAEDRIDRNYLHVVVEGDQPYEMSGGLSDSSGLRMDDLRGGGGVADKSPTKSDGRSAGGSAAGYHARQKGQGVAKKGAKPVDGRKGEASTAGAAGGSLRMDDLAGGGGVQDQGVGTSDGRKASNSASSQSESTVKVSGGDPQLAKGGYSSVGLSMGKDFQGSGKGSVVPKSLSKGDGAKGDGASSAKNYKMSGLSDGGVDMAKDFQGRGGLADQTPSGEHPGDKGKVGSDGGLKKASRKGDMSDQQGGGGVAESITPERIAELITLMENEACPCSGSGCGDKCKPGSCDKCEGDGCTNCCPCNDSCKCRGGTVSESGLPEALKKHQKKKKGESDDDSDSDS